MQDPGCPLRQKVAGKRCPPSNPWGVQRLPMLGRPSVESVTHVHVIGHGCFQHKAATQCRLRGRRKGSCLIWQVLERCRWGRALSRSLGLQLPWSLVPLIQLSLRILLFDCRNHLKRCWAAHEAPRGFAEGETEPHPSPSGIRVAPFLNGCKMRG